MRDPWYARLLGCLNFGSPWLFSEAGKKSARHGCHTAQCATSPATSLLATVTADQSALSLEYAFFNGCVVFGRSFTGKFTGFFFFHFKPKTQITSVHCNQSRRQKEIKIYIYLKKKEGIKGSLFMASPSLEELGADPIFQTRPKETRNPKKEVRGL